MTEDKTDKPERKIRELCGSMAAPDIRGASRGKLRPTSDD